MVFVEKWPIQPPVVKYVWPSEKRYLGTKDLLEIVSQRQNFQQETVRNSSTIFVFCVIVIHEDFLISDLAF